MTVPIVSPRLLSGMPGFFPFVATIQGLTVTYDTYGQPAETWADVSGWQDIKAAKAPLSAIERQGAGYTATDQVWNVLLMGAYPEITTRHRVVIDLVSYDIDAAETDQIGSLTRLTVRTVAI